MDAHRFWAASQRFSLAHWSWNRPPQTSQARRRRTAVLSSAGRESFTAVLSAVQKGHFTGALTYD